MKDQKREGPDLNGLIVHRTDETIFVPLPQEAWREIKGGCTCSYCKAHPSLIPSWDTLAIGATKAIGERRTFLETTWTVHRPELNPYRVR